MLQTRRKKKEWQLIVGSQEIVTSVGGTSSTVTDTLYFTNVLTMRIFINVGYFELKLSATSKWMSYIIIDGSEFTSTTLWKIVLFRDFLLPRPENGPGTQAGKERVLYYLQAHVRNDAIFSPKTEGKNHIWKKIAYLGIIYSECFYTGYTGIM